MKRHISRCISTLLLLCGIALAVASCGKEDTVPQPFSALFAETDHFIGMLDTVYERYDAFGKKATDTSDGRFTVTPIGRLIIVKKKALASDITYSQVQAELEIHYKNERKVNDVFLNNGGTVTIDCRK
jgi:hypothetical protein